MTLRSDAMATAFRTWNLLLKQHSGNITNIDDISQLDPRSTYIVVLEAPASQSKLTVTIENLIEQINPELKPRQIFEQLAAFSIDLIDAQADRLRRLPGIRSVEVDRPVPPLEPITAIEELQLQSTVSIKQQSSYSNGISARGDILPWGVKAVWNGEDVSNNGNIGSGTIVFVIDSGVLATTGDLNLNKSWSRSWIPGESAFSDGLGHGTHVAGTIAALANGIGVVGVAPGAEVVSLKIFSNSGKGASISSTIDAINYAVRLINTNNLDTSKVVINMSLGGSMNNSLSNAIINAANQGIRFTIAAGNNGQDVDSFSPANAGEHPNVYTISAVDSAYKMASWSNWDKLDATDKIDDVDFAAPGVDILSYNGSGQLVQFSGTSMAAPHVAGLLLTGGVKAGALTVANVEGTADQFALALDVATPTPTPSYDLITSDKINEGENLTVSIITSNVGVGTRLRIEISGNSIEAADFTSGVLSTEITIDSEGRGSFISTVRADQQTEGTESLQIKLFDIDATGTPLAEATVTIADTSIEPQASTVNLVLWGTTASDVISGGGGNDRLSGVMASGTSAAAMGYQQVDVLTGGGGTDVFLLGDSRGVFYNDRNSRTTGSYDYAQIKDFQKGHDKLQLFRSNYIATVINGSTSLYWDANNNGILNTSGFSQDELIAIITNATVTSSDLIWM